MVLKGKFGSQISSAVYLLWDCLEVNLLCTACVAEKGCADLWFCGVRLNVSSEGTEAALYDMWPFAVRSGFFPAVSV